MVHTSIEDHIKEVCPRCGKNHESKWHFEVDERHIYFKLTCEDCNYKVFKKIDFLTNDIAHIPL